MFVSGGVVSNVASAFKIRIRGLVMPLRVSKIGKPLLCKALRAWLTVSPGSACLINANAPVTWGVAMEVPWKLAYPPPGTDDVITWPGANNDRKEALLENDEIAS